MYNKYLGGTKVIKYVVNREKYKRRREARNKIKVWNPDKNENNNDFNIVEVLLMGMFILFLLKIIFGN